MFTSPQMRAILDRINAIEERYGDSMFPSYTEVDAAELRRLSEAYWAAKTECDALIAE